MGEEGYFLKCEYFMILGRCSIIVFYDESLDQLKQELQVCAI